VAAYTQARDTPMIGGEIAGLVMLLGDCRDFDPALNVHPGALRSPLARRARGASWFR